MGCASRRLWAPGVAPRMGRRHEFGWHIAVADPSNHPASGSVLARSTGSARRRNMSDVARPRTFVLLLSAMTAAALLAMIALAMRQPNLDLVQVGSTVLLSIPALAVG